jgi:hypothetical protein
MARRDIDVGELPSPATTPLAQMMRLLDEAEAAASAANKAAEQAKARKAAVKALALQAFDIHEQESARVRMESGAVVQYTPYKFRVFTVADEAAFKAWAQEHGEESFYDPEPKLREQLVIDEARRRYDDGEPLPPGVVTYEDDRISRTAIKTKAR